MDDLMFRRGWLSGFFDGEGGCYLQRYKRNGVPDYYAPSVWYEVKACNSDRALIDYACQSLDLLGILYRIHERPVGHKRTRVHWEIAIRRQAAIQRYADLVGFITPQKQVVLGEIVRLIAHRQAQPRKANGQFINHSP